MIAALASLGLLVALAVSTSMTDVTELQAAAPVGTPDHAPQLTGIEETDGTLQGSELR